MPTVRVEVMRDSFNEEEAVESFLEALPDVKLFINARQFLGAC